jgi:hypothetical protein
MMRTRKTVGRPLAIVGIVGFAAVSLGAAAAREPAARIPGTSGSAQRLSRRPIAEKQHWRRFDEAPARALVRPVRVLQVTGNVANARALLRPPSGVSTKLTYASGGTAPSLVLDYGKDVGGIPTFDISASSGARFAATYSEPLYNLGNDGSVSVALFLSGNVQRTDTFTAPGPGIVSATQIQGGERYERVTLTAPGTLSLRGAGIRFTPPRETPSAMRGHFLSSDPRLNRIWYAGAYTLNLNQLSPGTPVWPGARATQRLILDGAKRDRAVWSGDQVISDLTDYYVSDPRYARESLALFLKHPATTASNLGQATGSLSQPGPLPGACSPDPKFNKCFTWSASYSMLVMPALYSYYLYTGDAGLARNDWAAVVRQMRWDGEQVGSDGLFAVNSVDDSDWNIEKISGELTYVNAVYVEALESAAKLGTALGQRAQARAWSKAAMAIKNAVNRRLWDGKTGLYDASTTERGSAVEDANVIAVLAGIPSHARARRIMRKLQSRLHNRFGPMTVGSPVPKGYIQLVSPYMGSFHVLADFAVGDERAALANIRREWGYMISHDPGGVEWERIHLDGKLHPGGIADSAAHAWSTGPTTALSQYVLGVTPTAPGYRRWSVAPELTSLRWAQGVVPTPRGALSVRWQIGSADHSFKLTVIGPRNTTGVVAVPLLGRSRMIAMDGRLVWDGRHSRGGLHARTVGNAVILAGVRGSHTFAWVS